MGNKWLNNWQPVSERHRVYIERELGWEVSLFPQHPLNGIAFRVVAALDTYHNVIITLADDCTYGYVRLTWTQDPPYFEPIGDEEALKSFIHRGSFHDASKD